MTNRAAAVQMVSGAEVGKNLEHAGALIAEAAAAGAGLVALPENFALMGRQNSDWLTIAEPYGAGPLQDFLSAQARQHGIWLVGGTVPLQATQADKVRAACLVFDDRGDCAGRYDKLHLFDVVVDADSGESYTESDTFEAGSSTVTLDSPFGRIALAICYDLRFPELFRYMDGEAADIIVIPSAFTEATGRAHWELLLRARAVENLCYVIAPNQGGEHANGRRTFGNSMIVDPWGSVLDRVGIDPGLAMADIDLEQLAKLRKGFPALSHRRFGRGPIED